MRQEAADHPVSGVTTVNTRHRLFGGRLSEYVERHRLAWDLVMGSLAVVYVALAFRQDDATLAEQNAVWALALLFLTEFAARLSDASSRRSYLRSHWLDLVSAVPVPGIPGLRVLRLLRLFRLVRVGVVLRRWLLERGWGETSLIWPSMLLFWIASGLALWLVEHDVPGASIRTFPDAMNAAFLTATTLGFGNHLQPVTVDGQIIAGLTVFLALGLWGFASSRLTELWLRRDHEVDDLTAVHQELRLLREDLAATRESLRLRPLPRTGPAAMPQPDLMSMRIVGRMPKTRRRRSPSERPPARPVASMLHSILWRIRTLPM